MSQLLELTRARDDPDEQRAFAQRAVDWWTGAPVHAHAVAAGFVARAGDLAAARREVQTCMELGGWDTDRSYLWSVYVSNLADAAAALGDRDLAAGLAAQLEPLGLSCGVNGAVVAFAGCHAHAAAIARRALGHDPGAAALLEGARGVYQRLRAVAWLASCEATLAALRNPQRSSAAAAPPRPAPVAEAVLRYGDRSWSITHASRTATVPDTKGWRDLAVLLGRPGSEVHVLELSEAGVEPGSPSELADSTAIGQYRRRVAELEEARDQAQATNDAGRLAAADAERAALLDELERVTGLGGRPRRSPDVSERARTAVSARIREAIRRLEPALPELAAHLKRNVVTGFWCRFRAEARLIWRVEPGGGWGASRPARRGRARARG